MDKNKLAPIVLFVYNRPWHTQKTIQALEKNPEAVDSDLIVFSDGPKNESTQNEVSEVRSFLKTIDSFNSVRIVERDNNWGLANSIIDGVTKIVNEYGKIIVLEDDLVTNKYFLTFMNNALDYYKNENRVMHVSGWNYPINSEGVPETLFLRSTSCWGWGTWDRAWGYYEKDAKKLCDTFSRDDIYKFDYDGTAGMWSQVEGNITGKLNTWAIFWYATVFKQKGLCLHPVRTLVKNIGHDGSGEHCGKTDIYNNKLSEDPITEFCNELIESEIALNEVKAFYNNKHSLFNNLKNRLLKIIRISF